MTVRIFLLCFTAALLLIHTSNAQGIAGQIPPVYSVPKYINQGLTAYRQTQQIAQVANGLGLPVPQTQKIVTNVAVPLIPPALKLATNVGQPLVPQAQRFGANVGQPLLPKVFPGGLPHSTLHSRRPLPASTLLLNASPLLTRISPLQIRSTGEETKTEKEQTDTAEKANTEKEQADTAGKVNTEKEQTNVDINPINEISDDESKEVVGSSGSLYNETTTDEIHQTKTRSPDNKGDDLDYLSKAANPIDDIGSFIKKVGHGLKHSMEKIDTTLWPSHAKPEMKEAIDTIPFNEWANYPENRNLTYEKLLLKYIKEVNESRNPDNPLPIELSYLPPRQPNSQMKQVVRIDTIPFSEWATYPENRDLTYQQLMIKYIKEVNASRNPEYQLPIELAFLPPTHPNHRMKQAGRIDTIPFSEWATYPENRDLTYQQLMIKYIKEVNASRNPEYQLPIELAFLPPTRPNQRMKQAGRIDTIPFSEWATYPENKDLTYQQLMIKYIKEVNASRNPEYRLPIELAFLPPTRPNHRMKQAGRIDTIPFSEWATYPENRDLTYQQLMIKYIKEVNASRNPEYQLPIELAFLPPTRPNQRMNLAKPEGEEGGPFDIVPFRSWADYPENRNITHSELIEKYKNENSKPGFRVMDQLPTFGRNMIDQFHKSMSKSSLLQNTEQNSFSNFQNKETNPMDKLLNSAAKLADSFIDAMSGSGKNRNEPSDSGQRNNPISTHWQKASDSASQMADSEYPEKASGSTDQMIKNKEWQKMIDLAGQITDSNIDKDFVSNQKNNPLMYGAAEKTGKNAQFGIHPTEYYNQQLFHPFSPAFGGTYNHWNQPGNAGPILNTATNLAHSIRGFNNGEEYYKSSNPSEILSNPMTQYTAMYPVLSRTYRQMAPPLSHAGPAAMDALVSFEGRHFPPHEEHLIKRSGSSGNIWNSATGLADSITNIATNPGKINTEQILGSTGTIFNAAKGLAGDIGKVSTNPGSFANNPHGTFKQSDSLFNPVNPIGTIMNSASNLGSQITNMASNPVSVANSQLLGSARTLDSVSKQAVDVAGKIVNAALNPGINGNGQILQSSSPTYAGGFFPRNNPSGSIVNSATQLASQILNTAATNSGNIGKIPLLKSTSANGDYSPPLGSLFNSASKLAGDITSVATGKL